MIVRALNKVSFKEMFGKWVYREMMGRGRLKSHNSHISQTPFLFRLFLASFIQNADITKFYGKFPNFFNQFNCFQVYQAAYQVSLQLKGIRG